MAHEGATKQENFSVLNDQKLRKKMVRQDRWELDPETAFLQMRDQKLEIQNISPFGCAVLSKEIYREFFEQMAKSGHTMTVALVFHNVEVQTLTVRPVRIEFANTNSESAQVYIGLESAGEPFAIDCCKAIEAANEIVKKQQLFTSQASAVPIPFKGIVYEMHAWLMNLKREVDEAESHVPIDDAVVRQNYFRTISECVSDYLNEMLPKIYKVMPQYLNDISGEQRQACLEFARKSLGSLIYGAPFANRAYFKPLGYAGDFEMMNHLYRNETVGRCLFDQCLHKYFIDEPAGQAVKNRGEFLFQKIQQTIENSKPGEKVRILSIASGPALEQQLFLERLPQFHDREIEFNCLDQDEVSLKHAQRKIMTIARGLNTKYSFRFHHMAIKNVIGRGVPDPGYDLIYSAGLFDYFSDPVAQLAARKLFSAIKQNGTVIIGNFSKDNPSAAFMEIILDWILIYRSAEEMRNLFYPVTSNCAVEFEPLKINLFAILKP